ncbi:MAG TPA: PD-(D/E)XK nuclease family protein [Vicinamibacterales bacterium]
MITPRRTRLVRVPDLHVFRRVIAARASSDRDGSDAPPGSDAAGGSDVASGFSRTGIIVPTRGARAELQSWLASCGAADAGAAIVTRDELYETLHGRLPGAPPRLTAFERDAIAQAAAAEAARDDPDLPFQVRPGLVAEILRFYDHLRRQAQQVRRFEALIVDAIGGEEGDSGARRMLQQTRFLAAVFAGYERRVRESGAVDEHLLRERLIAEPPTLPLEHVVITVADWIADPAGLFVADFDMLARLPGIATLDLVATEAVLGSGFHQRVHDWWPGLEEIDGSAVVGALPRVRPRLVVPDAADPQQPWFVYRDREEELIAVADRLQGAPPDRLDRAAVVVKAPLPYLYLARDAFGDAGISYRTTESLPLATEPAAAAVDVVLDAVETRFARAPLVALLRSPHFAFAAAADDLAALDRMLSSKRYLGDLGRLKALAAAEPANPLTPLLQLAVHVAAALEPLLEPLPASDQLSRLAEFLTRYFKGSALAAPPADVDPAHGSRELRAREAVRRILIELIGAHSGHYDPEWRIEELAAAVRRWIGEETFVTPQERIGLHLIDDQAARYNEFDDLTVVGLIENEWPDRPRRNIFYPPALLKALGWPSEKDRRAAADARFLDLVASATNRVALSSFTLEDEALVTRSLQLDEVPRAMLSTIPATHSPSAMGTAELSAGGPWAELREFRLPADDPRFHGTTGALQGRPWSVSALETYLSCPFKFYAQHVLRLEEEPEDEEVMDPRRQGEFVHGVFETFFREWSAAGRGAITAADLDTARAVFRTVVEAALQALNEGEAGLERTRLLGSPAAAGLGEAVFRMEAERDVPVVERLLEHRLAGDLRIVTADGERAVAIRGKVDRIDLLADGTFRLIDYKLGWPPDRSRALQLPIYGLWAQQNLAGRRGRTWTLGEAAYLAFKGPRRVVPLFSKPEQRDEVLASAQQRLADAVDRIAAGSFPPSPTDVFLCESCSFAAVCRKDYLGDV